MRRASERFSDAQYRSAYSSVTLPIELFSSKLPEALRGKVGLCRLFTIKAAGRAPHEEIHRNSIQRLVSFRGEGVINCARTGETERTYTRHQIASPDKVGTDDIVDCWDVVPENTWHFPEALGNEQWFGVAFHSAPADAIIDEYVPITKLRQTGA